MPPSDWGFQSRPTMSTTLISVTDSGIRFTLANAGQTRILQRGGLRPEPRLHRAVRGDLGVRQPGHLGAEVLRQRTELEVHPRPQRPHTPRSDTFVTSNYHDTI